MTENNINLKLRSEVLEYSLQLEKNINDLVLINLGIFDDSKTRLFGYNSSITFKNKIDLLFDIDVLSKEENAELELLMNFRNKFLHVIECNSFSSVIEKFDNGLKNKFKKFFNEDESIENEESCRNALRRLQIKNIKTIKDKVSDRIKKSNDRHEIIKTSIDLLDIQTDLFFELIGDVIQVIDDSQLENENVRIIGEAVLDKCNFYKTKLTSDKNILELRNKFFEFFSNDDKVMNLYAIRRPFLNSENKTPNP